MAKRPVSSRRALRSFRRKLGLSARAAGAQLGVSHVALGKWERGESVPGPAFREALARWSDGAVPSSGWKVSPREKRQMARAAGVQVASAAVAV